MASPSQTVKESERSMLQDDRQGVGGPDSRASIGLDGRISLALNLASIEIAKGLPQEHAKNVVELCIDTKWSECPALSIVVMIVGSRGDVQPYLALGQQLRVNGHRVRLATHEVFQEMVHDAGLEFFSIGGNPHDLMSYMVKNPGLLPGIESLTNGDIVKKRKMIAEILAGCWQACHAPSSEGNFVAEAIISNPPAFAHIHCAEALGVPLLLSFTMPWSPTMAFPHPLVNIKNSKASSWMTANLLSYGASEVLQWQGVGDIINEFRTSTLRLAPLSLRLGAGLIDRLKIPWTYCMSPALVPKPSDWKNFIDIVGFYFLDLATRYTPKDDLATFLASGEPPIYIGFGSVVVDNPEEMTKTIFEATKQAGVRALVSVGWGGLGGTTVPSHVFLLGNVPHDWLFDKDRVAAVVHHGGAGTTAIGLAKGRPTVVVPFFGDQGFWGSMVHKAGAGPKPIPHKDLSVETLREAIKFAVSATAKKAAAALADKIRSEDGVRKGAESFYKHLPLLNMRCDLEPTSVAIWWSQEHYMKLGAFAAQILVDAKVISLDSLILHRPKEYKATKMLTPAGIYSTATSLFSYLANPTSWKKPSNILYIGTSLVDAYGQTKALISTAKAKKKAKKERKKAEEAAAAILATDESQVSKQNTRPASKDGPDSDTVVKVVESTEQPVDSRVEHESLALSNEETETDWDIVELSDQSSTEAGEHSHIASTTQAPSETPTVGKPKKPANSQESKEYLQRIRQIRLEQGHQASEHSTEVERVRILERFEGAKAQLSLRKLKYMDLLRNTGSSAAEDESARENVASSSQLGSPTPTPTPFTANEGTPLRTPLSENDDSTIAQTAGDDASHLPAQSSSSVGFVDHEELDFDDDIYHRNLEAAIKASLEDLGPPESAPG